MVVDRQRDFELAHRFQCCEYGKPICFCGGAILIQDNGTRSAAFAANYSVNWRIGSNTNNPHTPVVFYSKLDVGIFGLVKKRPYSRTGNAVRLWIRLQPNASKNRIGGLYISDELIRLKAYVRVVPEKGKANKALLKLLSRFLKCPTQDIKMTTGQTDRNKVLLISDDANAVFEKLENWFAAQSEKVKL